MFSGGTGILYIYFFFSLSFKLRKLKASTYLYVCSFSNTFLTLLSGINRLDSLVNKFSRPG